jgi:hypothetical protein
MPGDIVNDICDLGRLEKLIIASMPERPGDELRAADDAAAQAARIIKRHFELGHGPRVMAHRDEWAELINSRQLPDGSWPYNPQYMRDVRMIGHVSAGLWHLGAAPARRIAVVERLQRPAALKAWLDRREWARPWGGAGHDVIGLLQTMFCVGLGTRGVAQRVIDYTRELRDERGLMARGHFDEPGDQQFGATFAFGVVYDFLRVDFPQAPQLVEFILQRQHRSGSWSRAFPGGSLNMDAVYMLSRWTRNGSPQRPEAENALRKLVRWFVRELARLRGDELTQARIRIASTLGLLQEVFPSASQKNRIWRFGCDLTLHP